MTSAVRADGMGAPSVTLKDCTRPARSTSICASIPALAAATNFFNCSLF